MTKISIITPSYNQAEFIERTILSVITQKWDFEIEYIIMDWWSTDKTVEIIKNIQNQIDTWAIQIYCKKVTIMWKSEKDKWQSDAINKGMLVATGDIITYINSDDTYKSDAFEHVIKALSKSWKQRCYGKCAIIDKRDQEIRKPITWYKNFIWKKYSYAKLLTENFISQMTVFWTKEAMKEVWLFNENEHLCMDYEYWLRVWSKFPPIYIPKYIANFRFYQTSKSWSTFMKQFKDELRIAQKHAKWWYKWALFIHQINYYKIITIYKVLSLLKI